MQALTASFSTVHQALAGGTSNNTESAGRPAAAVNWATRSCVGGINGRPSPQPCAVAQRMNSTGSSGASTCPSGVAPPSVVI